MPESHKMTVQLIGKDDSNFDDFDMFTGRWQAYIDSFISVSQRAFLCLAGT